jgi:proton-dependent oligopeptide transporter, POT family
MNRSISTLKQPRGFPVFFLTEVWERFGFYISQTILILYLINTVGLTDSRSYEILSSFTALAYINPILGGYLADRFLGARQSVLIGIFFVFLGYVIISFSAEMLYTFSALAMITLGVGLLKPNIYGLLGTLYQDDDPRRHAGYTFFYVGVYVGIFLATSLGGYIQYYIGWQKICMVAAFSLVLAFFTFYFGTRYFQIKDLQYRLVTGLDYIKVFIIIALAIAMDTFIIGHEKLAILSFFIIAAVSVAIIFYKIWTEKAVKKINLIVYLLLLCISVGFWSLYFQIYFSMNLFIDRFVELQFGGLRVPTSFFVGIEALGIILFGPLLGSLWKFLEVRNKKISAPTKFIFGMITMSLAFGLLFLQVSLTNHFTLLLVGVYLIISIAELLVFPTTLAMVTEIIDPKLWGLMMGIFFVSMGLGGKLGGYIANFAAIPLNLTDTAQIHGIYSHAFEIYALLSLLFLVLSGLIIKIIRSLNNRF